ncbi:MAG TPA: HAD-IA family hydrolase [Flavisolibacter sp.]|jgi:putative hydrolase of the HAD superfamily|nr:HAD-IA family hydrolase [Flavisolibacter sp.]
MDKGQVSVLFFDIGGVLLSNGWGHESREKAAHAFGFDYNEMNYLHEFIFNVYETGGITLDEYLDTTLFYQPRSFTREDVKAFIYAESVKLPEMLDWLIEWKYTKARDLKFISINNEGRELNDYRIQKFGLRRLFDAFISSCEVGMRKPDPGIYKLALGIAQAHPEECLYFDDRSLLIDAGKKIGLQAVQHTDVTTTKRILETIR